jgi:hypothetical protein
MTVLLCPLASGQSGNGYAFFAPGQLRAEGESVFGLHFGGGAKYISSSGAGFGAEIGIAGPKDGFGEAYSWLFSPNGYFVFNPDREAKAQPFVTGGYTRSFGRDTGMNFGNFGGGVTYWAAERAGILAEYRHHITRDQGVTLHFWTVRLGMAFR